MWTYGYNSGARSGTSKHLLKGSASDETLAGLLNPLVLKKVKDFGIPATDLDVYFVQGGAAPGYSGAPVVNKLKNLVGIVDGGLDRGLSDYNWLVPANNLDALLASETDELPDNFLEGSTNFFSTVTYDSDAKRVIEYEHQGKKFSWVWTKTRSLPEIASTADAAEGVDQLLNFYVPYVKSKVAEEFVFDIYVEKSSGIVIALPKDAIIEHSESGGLFSRSKRGRSIESVNYSFLRLDLSNSDGDILQPGDSAFFPTLISKTLDCNSDVYSCVIDPGSMRVLDDEQGNKLLRFGVIEWDATKPQPPQYSYHAITVRNNIAFGAQFSMQLHATDCLISCEGQDESPYRYQKGHVYRKTSPRGESTLRSRERHQLEMLLSANLVTFSDLSVGLRGSEARQEANNDNLVSSDPEKPIAYYHGAELRFVDWRNKNWEVYEEGRLADMAVEVSREDTARGQLVEIEIADSRYRNTSWLIPVNGGLTYIDNIKLNGVLRPEPYY